MTTIFKRSLKLILIIGQFIGIINISYTLEPTGLSIRSFNSSYYSCLELFRMGLLVICSYLVYVRGVYYVQQYRLVKFWITIIIARVSEIWIIKLINAIIEYDQRHSVFSPALLLHKRAPSKMCWNIIITTLFLYFAVFELSSLYSWRPNILNIADIFIYIFNIPYIVDFIVMITVNFYLINIGFRFHALNSFWKCLPAGLVPVSDEWSHSEIIFLTENIRLLHAELSEILKLFNRGYGPLLLSYFVFNYIDIIYVLYLMIFHEFSLTKLSITEKIFKYLPLHIFSIQIIVFMIFIIMVSSWINDEKTEIISYLRLYKISNLPTDIKIQVKMFMKQISISKFDEITAFGCFNINLNLVITILALVMTGLSTLVQLKTHPIIIAMIDNTNSFHTIWKKANSTSELSNSTLQ